MTEALFAELVTDNDEESRRRCFSKFPATDNPVELIPNVGALFRYETETQLPCTPLYDRRLKVNFRFNPRLAAGDFKFRGQYKLALSDLEADVQKRVQTFRRSSSVVDGWFPELKDFPPSGPPERIWAAMEEVVKNREKVKAVYGTIRRQIFPKPEHIDEQWAFFRWTQAHLLASIEFVRKYGARKPEVIAQRIEYDLLDIEYVILGALAGALASRDDMVKKFFRLICPEGRLVY